MSFEEGKENLTADLPPQTEEMLSYLSLSFFPDVYPETSERTVTRNYQEDAPLEILFAASLVRNYPNRGPNEDGTEGS